MSPTLSIRSASLIHAAAATLIAGCAAHPGGAGHDATPGAIDARSDRDDAATDPAIDAAADQVDAAAAELPDTFTRGDTTYQLAWVEDFSAGLGSATLGDWTFQSNAAWLHPDNVAVGDGVLALNLTPRGAQQVDRDYLGAEYDRTGTQLFGRFLTRMRPVAPPGVIASFFTAFYDFSPEGVLRETAELDIEFVGTTRAVEFTIHWVDPQGVKRESNTKVPLDFDASDGFRTYEIEWLADRIVFYIEGVERHRFTDPVMVGEQAIPQSVMANIWISTAVNWAGQFDPASLPVASHYDWIAAYRLAP